MEPKLALDSYNMIDQCVRDLSCNRLRMATGAPQKISTPHIGDCASRRWWLRWWAALVG